MDVVLNAGAGERLGGGVASLPLVCPGLAIRADSQVPAPTDDPPPLSGRRPAGSHGATGWPRRGGGRSCSRHVVVTLKQDHRISRCGICYNINTVTAL